MASVLTPNWTDNINLVAVTTLARLATPSRITRDLTSKLGAKLYCFVGRGGTAALSAGIDIRVGQTANAGGIIVPNETIPFRGDATAAISTTCAAAGNPAGTSSLVVASSTSFVAGDLICIQDNAAPTALTEWARVSGIPDGTHILLASPIKNAHSNTAHTVRSHADVFSCWLEGGSVWEIIFDYGSQTTGDTITIQAYMATLDSYTAT